ncbi:MAG: acyl carrier protein [Chitinophagaceae bacterium]|nr:acyl carrier protein [Chitinophagaceae bacterium]
MENTKAFINIIYSIIPDFNISLISTPLKNAEIDSIDLVTIRVEFEKILGKTISDNDWLNFNSLQDIIDYCIIPNTNELISKNNQLSFDAKKILLSICLKWQLGHYQKTGFLKNWEISIGFCYVMVLILNHLI